VNDPVGIALMIGMIEFATHEGSSFWVVVREFALEMSIGLAIGAAGAWLVLVSFRMLHLANPALYPLGSLAAAGVIYGVAAVAHGSGFLAVFVAGIALGDAEYPQRRDVERFHTSLASLAEVVVFIGLGLTVNKVNLEPVWQDALLIALVLAFLARPLAIAPLLAPLRLRRGERVFVMWSGLKGAVPILLAAFALLEHVPGSERIYGIVFVVVAFSVIVQGATVPFVARRLGIPMRIVYAEAA
jgi:cell volume regulation protein A